MRHFTVSVLSMFIMLPTVAGAGLPVVNIASGGVSARSAFGEDVEYVQKQQVQPTRKKTVIARSAKPITTTQKTSVDTGEQIMAANDVLMPRRPSNDLWAKNTGNNQNDFALRMPMPNEFSVIRSDNPLPEESIDNHLAALATQTTKSNVTEHMA